MTKDSNNKMDGSTKELEKYKCMVSVCVRGMS